jgi:NAD(P)-dependent dehydrogenase (short-subunit alcohol dehydrogenase family)
MQSKPVALITGANKGIGLQITKDLATHGFIPSGAALSDRTPGADWDS